MCIELRELRSCSTKFESVSFRFSDSIGGVNESLDIGLANLAAAISY